MGRCVRLPLPGTSERSSRAVLEGRTARGWTQAELSRRAKVSAGMVAVVERGDVNASIDLVGRLVTAVGVTLDLRYRVPFGVARQSDRAHARCVAYVQRRLERDGWHVRREVEITHGLSRGWIDLVAWHPVHRTLLVVEVKTEIHDVGLIERTLGWYERAAQTVAAEAGWRPVTVSRWLLLLATDANDRTLAENAEALRQSFPDRAAALATAQVATSGMALIDPRSRCSRWLIAARVDGRRSPAPYADYRTFVEAAYRR